MNWVYFVTMVQISVTYSGRYFSFPLSAWRSRWWTERGGCQRNSFRLFIMRGCKIEEDFFQAKSDDPIICYFGRLGYWCSRYSLTGIPEKKGLDVEGQHGPILSPLLTEGPRTKLNWRAILSVPVGGSGCKMCGHCLREIWSGRM